MNGQRLARWGIYVGVVLTVVVLSNVHANFIADPPYSFTGSFRFAWALAFMTMLAVTAYGVGLPDLPRSLRSAIGTAVAAVAVPVLGISAFQLFGGDALLPRFVVFGSALILVPWYVVCWAYARGGRLRAEGRDQVVVVGRDSDAELLRHDLGLEPERPAVIVATVTGADLDRGGGRRLIEVVTESHASIVVVTRDALADERVVTQAAQLHERGLRIRTMSLFYEQWLGKLPLSELERVSLLFDIGEVHRSRYGRFKRLLDLLVGSVGLVAFAVAVPFVLVGNLLGNRGPLFYLQTRVGKNGREFQILKFRTMRSVPEGEAATTVWTSESDPRITPFGKLLRTSHLDELPQMVNIVRGELSIVGPRPEQPHYVAELAEKLPFYDLRHLVRPGLTGWAQVKYGYASGEEDAMEKLQYEFFYLRHQTVALDLRIIGRTVRSVLRRAGR